MSETRSKKNNKAKVRTFSTTARDDEMLEAIAHYHGTSKSAAITGLVRKEFWRIFPNGTETIPPDEGAATSHE
jgi:hypothetical protein